MSLTAPILVWFRGKDLRTSDHEPLCRAAAHGAMIPVFVLDPFFFEPTRAQALPHRMQFLLESLVALRENLRAKGSDLILTKGRSIDRIPELAARFGARLVFAHRWSEPFGVKRDAIVHARLAEHGAKLKLFEGELLRPPGQARTADGGAFRVFTPFARAHLRLGPPPAALAAPRRLPALPSVAVAASDAEIPTFAELGLVHNAYVLRGGERAARARLRAFLAHGSDYASARDCLGEEGTSRLSQDLKFGTLSVRSVWHAAEDAFTSTTLERFWLELLWRSFHHENLVRQPELLEQPFLSDFADFPWREDRADLAAWQRGETGYPVVDAAARQLLATGYVHNRARMIAASFLTKHLLLPYAWGEAHYMKYLTDGDWAQNNGNWQWSAGCGTDAQPYFRIFNPITQGQKFDANGRYVRAWLPELARLENRWLHAPWLAPAEALASAGITLGRTYPHPLVDHSKARARFLGVAKTHLRRGQSGGASA